ncbi:hypothetical protein VNO78_24061 [Psophocarpus tetragonolobus]|uniref:AP2/ERF domain-containing protein n=1 Tax=Psophocarpus tetragonolobus TaxID=3891 RepID=A0AAN9S5K2_PSOTE
MEPSYAPPFSSTNKMTATQLLREFPTVSLLHTLQLLTYHASFLISPTCQKPSFARMASSSSSSSKRHPVYHGIRCRGGKWVTEIREPRKTNRIWLGTFQMPEMAAAAYDVAALALKGGEAVLNFPDSVGRYPVPSSKSPADIRTAAIAAAELMKPEPSNNNLNASTTTNAPVEFDNTSFPPYYETEFLDEEAIFSMPSLLIDMAGGMLLSPPRMSPPSDDSTESYGGETLWSF